MADKKHILCISGGKDSMATAILALEHGEPIDMAVYCEVMFDENISGEVPEHRDFMYHTIIPWLEDNGIKVSVIRGGKSYLDCFYQKIGKRSKSPEKIGKHWAFPMAGRCFVQRDCKVVPMQKYIKSLGEDVVLYNGIAIDEPERLERMRGTNRISLLEKYGYTEEMAAELCKQHDLYSPAYQYSDRNGCWFCPNCKISEFAEFKRRHPDLWKRLLDLGKEENLISNKFRYNMTIEEVDQEISMQAAQLRLCDLEG